MNMPSRRMPSVPIVRASIGGWLFLAGVIAGVGYWFWQQPYLVGILGVLVWILIALDTRFRRRLADSRQEESICKFAHSFDRKTDTWVIRAVYEELSSFLAVDGRTIPVRRQDNCEKDLRIDPEDLEDIARDAAFRARRSMDDCEKNPLYGKVQTVADIVCFLSYQPRIVERSDSPVGKS